MPTVFACPTCGTRLKVPGKFAGREVQCPHCKKLLVAPRKSASRSDPDDDDVDELDQYIIPVDADGRQKRRDEKYCQECGEIIRAKAVIVRSAGSSRQQAILITTRTRTESALVFAAFRSALSASTSSYLA